MTTTQNGLAIAAIAGGIVFIAAALPLAASLLVRRYRRGWRVVT